MTINREQKKIVVFILQWEECTAEWNRAVGKEHIKEFNSSRRRDFPCSSTTDWKLSRKNFRPEILTNSFHSSPMLNEYRKGKEKAMWKIINMLLSLFCSQGLENMNTSHTFFTWYHKISVKSLQFQGGTTMDRLPQQQSKIFFIAKRWLLYLQVSAEFHISAFESLCLIYFHSLWITIFFAIRAVSFVLMLWHLVYKSEHRLFRSSFHPFQISCKSIWVTHITCMTAAVLFLLWYQIILDFKILTDILV